MIRYQADERIVRLFPGGAQELDGADCSIFAELVLSQNPNLDQYEGMSSLFPKARVGNTNAPSHPLHWQRKDSIH